MKFGKLLLSIIRKIKLAVIDLLPIIIVIAFFQAFVLKQPLPDIADVIFGSIFVILGLMLFVEGLEMGLFPIGEAMADALARKGSVFWLFVFSFALGFSTTIAEPALIAIADKAAQIAAQENLIDSSPLTMRNYALGLRISVAVSVGIAVVIGVLRILKGWPVYYLIIGGYVLVMIMTVFSPAPIIGLAYDSGGVTTSTITVPLITALGVGLATIIKGRNPLLDGFGLIAFASLLPMIFVMIYGLFWF
ncbi:MAG: DUF1538 domain-containing protein [Bacteroidales bacterium]|nr:DUF1538 domain-containing protein [Bacteroidales bacterium]